MPTPRPWCMHARTWSGSSGTSGGLGETASVPPERAGDRAAASSVAHVLVQYAGSLRPCITTSSTPRRRAPFRQALLAREQALGRPTAGEAPAVQGKRPEQEERAGDDQRVEEDDGLLEQDLPRPVCGTVEPARAVRGRGRRPGNAEREGDGREAGPLGSLRLLALEGGELGLELLRLGRLPRLLQKGDPLA